MADHYLMPTYNRQPLAFTRGEGVWLYDDQNQAWLDAIAGIGVCNLGHCHPGVTAALREQAGQLVHTSNLYHIGVQEQLAATLCRLADMEKVFFCNSGAEANETAIKLARLYGHQRDIDTPQIVVMDNAFHGRTLASLSATGNPKAQQGFEPMLDGFIRVPFNDLDALAALTAREDIAAVLVEPVQGEGGVRLPTDDYLPGVRELCDRQGWLLMLDEVQTGNGRSGHYFACQHYGVTPDVISTAKGLGNGYPIGACLARGPAADVLGPGNHGSTFGGNPLGCATALAVVEALNEQLPAVAERGARLRRQLEKQLEGVDLVRDIRGLGLMVAVELDRPCTELVGLCRERHLLANVTADNVIRLLPPLVISDADMDTLVDRLTDAIRAFVRQQEAA